MAESKNDIQSTSASNAEDVEYFNLDSGSDVCNKVTTISHIILPPWNLPSTSASVEVLAAPSIERPALYEGQTADDTINSAGDVNSDPILRTYLATGEKLSTFTHSVASVDQNIGGDGTLPQISDFDLGDINFSQCTDNITLYAFDELMSPSLNFEEVPSVVNSSLEKPPSKGELSEDEFTTVGKPTGKVRMFKGKIPTLSLNKQSTGKHSLKRCESIISAPSLEGALSEDEFDTPIKTKRVRMNRGRFSKGRLITTPVEKRPLEKHHLRRCISVLPNTAFKSSDAAVSENEFVSLSGCSQSYSVFSQQSDRDILSKFEKLKRATVESTKGLEEQIKLFNNSLQNEEKKMSIQNQRVEQARQSVEEARLNLQRAMFTLDAEEVQYNVIRNDVQILQQSAESCQKELAKAQRKYERLR